MASFQPEGPKARWRVIYEELLDTARPGTIITWRQLGDLLGVDPVKERAKIVSAWQRATRQFLEVRHHAVRSVPGVGYVVTDARQQLEEARKIQRRAMVTIHRGHQVATKVDLTDADPEVRQALEQVALAFARQADLNARFERRQTEMESALDALSNQQQRSERRTETELAAIRASLDRLTKEGADAQQASG